MTKVEIIMDIDQKNFKERVGSFISNRKNLMKTGDRHYNVYPAQMQAQTMPDGKLAYIAFIEYEEN